MFQLDKQGLPNQTNRMEHIFSSAGSSHQKFFKSPRAAVKDVLQKAIEKLKREK